MVLWCAFFGMLPLSGCISRIVQGRTLASGLGLRKAGAQHQFCYGLSMINFVQVVESLLGVVLSLLVRDWRMAGRLGRMNLLQFVGFYYPYNNVTQ